MLDISKMTLSKITELKQLQLDEAWKEKYPAGSFTTQRRDRLMHFPSSKSIYYNVRRRTGSYSPRGVGVEDREGTITIVKSQNNSMGKCEIFRSPEELINHARKIGFSDTLIECFMTQYYKFLEDNK